MIELQTFNLIMLAVVTGIYFLILSWKIDNIKYDIKEIKRKMNEEK